MKIKIKEIIVVEGRDDTTAVQRAVDAETIETHGFGMSDSMWNQIEKAYLTRGIIVFTDPDYAGEQIRKKILARFPDSKQAFLSREAAYRRGDIGIENACPEDIISALKKAKCTKADGNNEFTETDLRINGLIGTAGSKEKREALGEILGIGYGNSKVFLKKLNGFGITREEFNEKVKEL